MNLWSSVQPWNPYIQTFCLLCLIINCLYSLSSRWSDPLKFAVKNDPDTVYNHSVDFNLNKINKQSKNQ